MHTLFIDEFDAHFYVPRSAWDERQRLEQVLRAMIDTRLEQELVRAGVSATDEICIREIRFPVRLSLTQTDERLISMWASTFAKYVLEAATSGESHIAVRYVSRIAAMIDFAASVAAGDLQRAWAWRQLFFADQSAIRDETGALERLVSVLCRHPHWIVPVLRDVARRGELLTRLLRRMSVKQREMIAIASLRVLGVSESDWRELHEAICNTADLNVAATQSGVEAMIRMTSIQPPFAEVVARILRRSPLAAAIKELSTSVTHASDCMALTALATMDVDPALFQSDLERIAGWLRSAMHWIFGRSLLRISQFDTTDSVESTAKEISTKQLIEPGLPNEIDVPTNERLAEQVDQAEGPAAESASSDEPEPVERERRDSRTSKRSNFGGLLYLVHIIGELDLPRQIAAHPAFGARPMRWTLHQLALSLVDVEPDDAAALAMAGLPPNALPPSRDEPLLSAQQRDQLALWRQAITDGAAKRLSEFVLSRRRDPSDNSAEQEWPDVGLLDWICRRPANVVADTGWFEVRFALKEVSTVIRGAGLDLDPGYVPWLGVVVKFFYA